jgi:hypothetical protein
MKPDSNEVSKRLGVSQRHARRLIAAGDDRVVDEPLQPLAPKPVHEDSFMRLNVHEADLAFDRVFAKAKSNLSEYSNGMEFLCRLKLASIEWQKCLAIAYDWQPEEVTDDGITPDA